MLRLHRYWIEFEVESECPRPGFGSTYGVTGYDLEDALQLLRQHVFAEAPLTPIHTVIEDVDVSTLDPSHVLPNIGVSAWRGVWWPRLNV